MALVLGQVMVVVGIDGSKVGTDRGAGGNPSSTQTTPRGGAEMAFGDARVADRGSDSVVATSASEYAQLIFNECRQPVDVKGGPSR